jgi:hypothetical protein
MGFLEWLGVKSYKPDYGEAMNVYERMMDTSDIDKMRESRMADWKQMQQQAFGDITKSVGQRWGGTGATTLGIESGIPAAWGQEASGRWMQQVGNPMARSIEQEWLGATQQQKMSAEMARQQLEEQARAEAAARTGAGTRLLGTLAGGFVPGAGGLISGLFGGGGGGGSMFGGSSGSGFDSTMGSPYSGGGGSYGGAGGYNYYFDPQYLQNQGNPVYYPSSPPGGGGGGWSG